MKTDARIAVFHPDLKSRSQRGIYLYAKSLIAALDALGYSAGLVTDTPIDQAKSNVEISAILDDIKNPKDRRLERLFRLPGFIKNKHPAPHNTQIISNFRNLIDNEKIDFLRNASHFINIQDFYELARISGNKRYLPTVDISYITKTGHSAAITTAPMRIKSVTHKPKIIQTVHDLIVLNTRDHDLDRLKFARRLQSCVDHSDVIMAVSEYTRQEIIERHPCAEDRIRVVYQPLPANQGDIELSASEEFQSEVMRKFSLEKGTYFFFVGAIEKRKNIARLIQAHQKSQNAKNHKLVLAGSCDNRYLSSEGIAHLFNENPTTALANTQYIGRVTEAEKLALLRNAIALTFPSLSEGFGIPILEAQSVGCPVITSNVSAIPEVTLDSALLISDPRDIEELSAALDLLCTSDSSVKALREKGLRNAQRFSKENFSFGISQLLHSI